MTEREINLPRPIARVAAVWDSGERARLSHWNGFVSVVDVAEGLTLARGDVVAVDSDGDPEEVLPRDSWPEASVVGVVRNAGPETALVDAGGQIFALPVSAVDFELGNTVRFNTSEGILEVLHQDPVRANDLPELPESEIAAFEVSASDEGPGFEDFGGYKDVVARAKKLIELPLVRHDELAKIGARPIKGVLFTGEPGTGKTHLARIIANHADAHFFLINGPEVFSKWVGQSEDVLRRVFKRAEDDGPSIIFFDEIDSVASQRDGESHEMSQRVVAQLLTLMDGFTASSKVTVIASTNRRDELDVALRRPGRFDWEIHFPLPNEADREEILIVSSRHLSTKNDLPFSSIARQTTAWSAADLTAIWSEAALLAAEDKRDSIADEDFIGGFETIARQRVEKASAGKPETTQD